MRPSITEEEDKENCSHNKDKYKDLQVMKQEKQSRNQQRSMQLSRLSDAQLDREREQMQVRLREYSELKRNLEIKQETRNQTQKRA